MRFFFAFVLLSLVVACSKLEVKQLEGRWEHQDLGLEFMEGQRYKLRLGMVETTGTYRPVFNSLEMVNEEGKVLFNLNVKSVTADSLVIDMPRLGSSQIYNLVKVK